MPARTKPPDVAKLTADSLVSFSEARALVASCDTRDSDDERSARDRAGNTLKRHIRKGRLALAEVGLRQFRAGELGRFLRSEFPDKFPGKFDDMPANATVTLRSLTLTAQAGAFAVMGSAVLPDTVSRCHDELRNLAARISALQNQLRVATSRISDLQPPAERWRRLQEQNRRNAQRKRERKT